ncbi:C40 family peptidase [Secundilactobacillus oryzae]|uniref:C40 family peptidase n=1 Tax=Secundilactobacillus oryzae TaxID=1202668 RepID=UPI000A7B0157|nr:NlpC/P60 family protein [Secundilactobacillus oryzae]
MEIRRVIVPVATIWTKPDAPRKEDRLALEGDVAKWVSEMSLESSIDLADGDRLATQALFNDQVEVLETQGNWAKVSVLAQQDDAGEDGYQGWVPLKLLSQPVSEAFVEPTTEVQVAIPKTSLLDAEGHPVLEITMGTAFKVVGSQDDLLEVETPLDGQFFIEKQATEVPVTGASMGDQLVALAKQFMGLRYLWAGISPYGFDCSGLTYNLHRVLGVEIPRDADDQSENGTAVAPEDLKPGDLLFFLPMNVDRDMSTTSAFTWVTDK